MPSQPPRCLPAPPASRAACCLSLGLRTQLQRGDTPGTAKWVRRELAGGTAPPTGRRRGKPWGLRPSFPSGLGLSLSDSHGPSGGSSPPSCPGAPGPQISASAQPPHELGPRLGRAAPGLSVTQALGPCPSTQRSPLPTALLHEVILPTPSWACFLQCHFCPYPRPPPPAPCPLHRDVLIEDPGPEAGEVFPLGTDGGNV